MKMSLGFLFATLGLAVGGCGKGNSSAYQAGSDNCSSEFVSDFNKVTNSLAFSTDNFNQAEGLVNQFGSKYKDVVCKAGSTSSSQLGSSTATIDANATTKAWREAIAEARRHGG